MNAPASALALLVLRILANDHNAALAFDDLTLFADFLDRRPDFHEQNLLRADGAVE